jgi:phage host-nuclease inhibitor protein Gam
MNDEIAAIKQRYETAVNPIRDEVTSLTDGIATWASAHRAALTGDGRTKTADLGTGRISWRRRPPRVSIRNVDAVLQKLKSLGLHKFIRTKEEINKEAMQAEPEAARGIVGVTIGSAGEDFIVEPFEADLQSTTAA